MRRGACTERQRIGRLGRGAHRCTGTQQKQAAGSVEAAVGPPTCRRPSGLGISSSSATTTGGPWAWNWDWLRSCRQHGRVCAWSSGGSACASRGSTGGRKLLHHGLASCYAGTAATHRHHQDFVDAGEQLVAGFQPVLVAWPAQRKRRRHMHSGLSAVDLGSANAGAGA